VKCSRWTIYHFSLVLSCYYEQPRLVIKFYRLHPNRKGTRPRSSSYINSTRRHFFLGSVGAAHTTTYNNFTIILLSGSSRDRQQENILRMAGIRIQEYSIQLPASLHGRASNCQSAHTCSLADTHIVPTSLAATSSLKICNMLHPSFGTCTTGTRHYADGRELCRRLFVGAIGVAR
jgi:hypothetical protein